MFIYDRLVKYATIQLFTRSQPLISVSGHWRILSYVIVYLCIYLYSSFFYKHSAFRFAHAYLVCGVALNLMGLALEKYLHPFHCKFAQYTVISFTNMPVLGLKCYPFRKNSRSTAQLSFGAPQAIVITSSQNLPKILLFNVAQTTF